MARSTAWFVEGAAALERASDGRRIGEYGCPLCMTAFRDPADLTREHVPAASVGGRRLILTCAACNHTAGHALDKHVRPARALAEFASGSMHSPTTATLRVGLETLTVDLKATGTNIFVDEVAGANDPQATARVLDALGFAGGALKVRSVQLEFGQHHRSRAQISMLRSGYLAAFAKFGYRYIAPLRMVRQQITDPANEIISRFHLEVSQPSSEPLLAVGSAVGWGPCVVATFGTHGVILPPPSLGSDDWFWNLGASRSDQSFRFSGSGVGWPQRGEYLLDS